MIYFVTEIKWGTDIIKIIKRKTNLVPVGRAFFWKILIGLVKIVTWTWHHSWTVMLYQICLCLMKWVWKCYCPVDGLFDVRKNVSLQTTEFSAHVDKLHGFCCSFLAVSYIIQVFRTDGLWFDIMWLGHIFVSCFWNWGQMLAYFSGIFMLWSTGLAQENFWNLLKMYGLSWPSLTLILRITLNAFLKRNFLNIKSKQLHKH